MKIKNLPPNSYFKTINTHSPASFLFDDEGRFTRLWNGSYVDGFFKDGEYEVETLSREDAVKMAKDFRNLV
jgi:hypothetical protein